MSTLALNINMHGKVAVIIGGGNIALRKLRTLLAAGAYVRIVALQIIPEIARFEESVGLAIRVGNYTSSDIEGAFLVVAATDNAALNAQICQDAYNKGILVSATDNPALGDCTFPAILRRGDLEIAVSTSTLCPTFAVDVRDAISGYIGQEYGIILQRLATEREKLLTNGSPSTYNAQVLRSLAAHLLAELNDRKGLLP